MISVNKPSRPRFVLGTVNFGLDYGINNPKGRLGQKEVKEILDLAASAKIDTLDSASSYGASEKVIGRYLHNSANKFKVISKFCSNNPEQELASSLKKLNIPRLEGYLFHRFEEHQKDKSLFDRLLALKKQKLTRKIGFSLYFPRELEEIFAQDLKIDLIQIPYSVFDQRFAPLLIEAKKRRIEVHARSVFLQGLIFKQVKNLSRQFIKIKPKIAKLCQIAQESELSLSALALAFAYQNQEIDRLVIGVDSAMILNQNIGDLAPDNLKRARKYMSALQSLAIQDEKIILPMNWK